MHQDNTLIGKKILAFIGIWQGVVLPSIPELTEVLQLTSASLGVLVGVVTLFNISKKKK